MELTLKQEKSFPEETPAGIQSNPNHDAFLLKPTGNLSEAVWAYKDSRKMHGAEL